MNYNRMPFNKSLATDPDQKKILVPFRMSHVSQQLTEYAKKFGHPHHGRYLEATNSCSFTNNPVIPGEINLRFTGGSTKIRHPEISRGFCFDPAHGGYDETGTGSTGECWGKKNKIKKSVQFETEGFAPFFS